MDFGGIRRDPRPTSENRHRPRARIKTGAHQIPPASEIETASEKVGNNVASELQAQVCVWVSGWVESHRGMFYENRRGRID